jgi:predicted RNA-binding Zn ribbon-like protein
MRLSQRTPLPVIPPLGLLYEFANSLDLRRYRQRGQVHAGGDELATVTGLELWLRGRGLLDEGAGLDEQALQSARRLRASLRAFLQLPSSQRAADKTTAALLNNSSANFPLVVQIAENGKIQLAPRLDSPLSGLASVLSEFHCAAETDTLDRLKMCASEECRWVFYDRSKPSTRRWCASALCGNRQNTRTYRERRRKEPQH